MSESLKGFIAVGAALYLSLAFIMGDFDAFNWPMELRVIFIIAWGFIGSCVAAILEYK